MKLLRRIAVLLLAAFAASYFFDAVVYYARGKPGSTVQVVRLIAVPLKGGKTEYDPAGSSTAACSSTLFP
jgi:hypothetical protein